MTTFRYTHSHCTNVLPTFLSRISKRRRKMRFTCTKKGKYRRCTGGVSKKPHGREEVSCGAETVHNEITCRISTTQAHLRHCQNECFLIAKTWSGPAMQSNITDCLRKCSKNIQKLMRTPIQIKLSVSREDAQRNRVEARRAKAREAKAREKEKDQQNKHRVLPLTVMAAVKALREKVQRK